MKSWKRPTPEQLDRAVALIGQKEHRRYFFDRIENPEWIDSLFRKGFFQNPPAAERDDAKGTVGFPPWPESLYLARMAYKKPRLVLQTILQASETDNINVHEDFAAAALAMPAELSAEWAEKEAVWIKGQDHLFFVLPRTLGKLISHLSQGGEVDASLNLAKALLDVLPDPKVKEKAREDRTFSTPPQPTVRFDQWEYEEILKKNVPSLVTAAGIQAIELLCNLLETAVRYSQKDGAKGAPWDYSWIWRPAVEDHPQNRHHGLRSILVTALRDACESLVRNRQEEAKVLVGMLEGDKYSWHIFRRIALHLLRLFRKPAADLIAERLTNFNLFDTHAFRHEYALLLRDCFGLLSDDKQKFILSWIEQGPPDLDEYKKREDETTGKCPTEEDIRRYLRGWQRTRLAWFSGTLPEEWKKRYEEMVAEFGEPDHPEFASYSKGVQVGPTSPKVAAELEGMSVSEIIKLCEDFKPTDEFMAPSPEGLGRELSAVVSERPERFLKKVSKFQSLDPTYVRAILSGIRSAIGKGKVIDWQAVFELCGWVVIQRREVNDEEDIDLLKDPHWGWARKTIADLLSEGFKKSEGSIPFKYRKTVWNVLEPISHDPDPTPEYEAEYLESNVDPSSLSINTTRGEAMHAVVRYALWVRECLGKEPGGKEKLACGLQEMPEVLEVLATRLDMEEEKSLAVRSVYGRWFPWLVLIDSRWAKEAVNKVFPSSEKCRLFWDTAWQAYIMYCDAYDDVFEILQNKYALAVERLGDGEQNDDSYTDVQKQLAKHLMVFYWRGKLSLDDPDGLLAKLFEKATPQFRGAALRFVGQSVRDEKSDIKPEILERMIRLWERRLEVTKNTQDPSAFAPEMESFGWWFASGKFDDAWAIKQLLEALKLVQKTDPNHLVVDRLTEVSEKFRLESVQCLELLAKGDREGWKIHGWIEEAKTILSHAMQSGGSAAESAEHLIHYLGSRGYLQFRPLLQGHL